MKIQQISQAVSDIKISYYNENIVNINFSILKPLLMSESMVHPV